MPPRLSTSKAYWNLRAEQVMDRVFNDDDHTLEAVEVQVEAPPTAPATSTTTRHNKPLTWPQVCLAAVGVVAVLGSAGLTLHWRQSQQALERDRNLALLEQLQRQPSPATDASTVASPPNDGELSEGSSSDAASDPELAQSGLTITPLPSAPPAQLEPITLPIPSAAIAPPVTTEPLTIPAEPLLVGVVHSGNGGGSAIFQIGDLSVSSFPGEPIGNSGWTLRSVSANGAVMEREGAQRSLSVGGAF
ncbi:hypothetical protein [Synechococcus sp. NOUM97013]|uniref:hypothetical protein n=1 Tax=Synechococcus sp. NOUM97013 TaxID=1442555 RepID=UPI0016466A2F|nr:hypothetical protein [Synechococcus sp. NOUM97013]QNI74859.1 putative conserved membrane protein [Synechococcus sp. NOUM97013]